MFTMGATDGTQATSGTWTVTNSVLLWISVACLVAGLEVFLFGAVFTNGVYGSRMAWLVGVAVPLLLLGAIFGTLAARIGRSDGPRPNAAGRRRIAARRTPACPSGSPPSPFASFSLWPSPTLCCCLCRAFG